MPSPDNLTPIEITFSGGYWPSVPDLAPEEYERTIKEGSNVWLRSGGKLRVANGLSERSSTNVGARIFAADIQRATIAGGLVGSRLPYAGFLRYENAVLFFLSEHTSQQVYLNEVAISGLTTSSTAGRLRIATPDGVGGFTTVDAGFDKPATPTVTVTTSSGEARTMSGAIGVALSSWRSRTRAVGPPSETTYNNITPVSGTVIRITLPAPVTGQDGYAYLGTRWNDQGGELRVLRYVYRQPRGTFSTTNSSPNLTAGVGTFWTQDLRAGDVVTIDGNSYTISAVTSDTTATLTANFSTTGGSGKVMTITGAAGAWFNKELGRIISRDTFRAPRAAGVLKYAGRVFLWGIPDTNSVASSLATGNAILVTLRDNPEHVGAFAIVTESGSDLVNVLGAKGPLYLMTTTGLEVVSFTGDPNEPYKIRIVASPGFAATTNGCLFEDYFYGFIKGPLRIRADTNVEDEFAEPVLEKMAAWTPERVIVREDPKNKAVLYVHDNGVTTEVVPYMHQLGRWSPPLNFSARIIDAAVVNGTLDLAYLSGGNFRVNEWEGGAGIGGTPFAAGQFYDRNAFRSARVKRLKFAGKATALRVYAALEGSAIPDVSNVNAASAVFTLSDTLKVEPEIKTHIPGDAFAFRIDFSNNGRFDKLVARGLPRAS